MKTQACIYNAETTIITSEDRKKYVLFYDSKPMDGLALLALHNTIEKIGKNKPTLPNRY